VKRASFCQGQGFNTIAGEQKVDGPVANLVPELLLEERLHVWFVIDNQDPSCHPARSTRVSISLRSVAKSMHPTHSLSQADRWPFWPT
jgi:hypothetical protein